MIYSELEIMAMENGFTACAPFEVSQLELKKEVRDMCADNSCGKYGKCWSCPPHCGTLEECADQVSGYQNGILVQTVGDIEDSFDFESMMEIEAEHKKQFEEMYRSLLDKGEKILALGAGCCTICRKCTCPDEPCRFTGRRLSSMEAYGLVVMDVCKASGLKYYYGPEKMAYTSCFLF